MRFSHLCFDKKAKLGGKIVKPARHLLATGAAIGIVAAAAPVHAQEAANVPAAEVQTEDGDIIVRAQRRAQSALDVPVQVTSLDADRLDDAGVTDLSSLGDRIPNTYFGSNTGYGTPAFSIRGVGGTLSTGGEEPVAIFFDDQFIPRTFPSALLDVESVEVLRGPQVTLYGRNATAGAILLRSARPDLQRITGYARAQISSFDSREIEGALSVPLSDTLGVRVAALYSDSDGWVTNTVNGSQLNRNESGRGRISALWEPSADFELYANFEYGKSTFSVARAGIADRTRGNRFLISETAMENLREGRFSVDSPVDQRREDARATLSATWKFNAFDLIASAGYSYAKFGGNTDSDATGQRILFNSGQFRFETYSQDLRLVSRGSGPFEWIVGASALEDTYEMPYFFIRNVPTNRDTHFSGRIPGTALAAYAEGTYKFTDTLSLTIGGRYTYEEKRAAISLQSFDLTTGTALAPVSSYRNKKSWQAFKPRGILQFKPVDNVNLYASISTGFKSGGYNVFALSSPFNDENIIAYEAGAKGRFLDNMLNVSAAAFHYDYKDLQLRLGVPTGGVIIQNAADAKIDGFEAEASLNLRNGLELFGSASVLDARLDSYVTRDLAGNLVDAAGARMSRAPSFSGSFGGSYEQPIGGDLFGRLSATLTYRGKIYFLETDQDAATFLGESLTNIDLRVSVGRVDKKWSVSAFVKNLTDNVEVTQVELQGNFPVATFNEPRRFGLELSTRF